VRITLGYEQVGAAGIASAQKYAFDFFISRPLPIHDRNDNNPDSPANIYGPRWRWWGDVQLGSYPQPGDSSLTQLSSTFATAVGQLKVNQLVQNAAFETGPEWRLAQSSTALASTTDTSRQRFMLTAFAGIGSIGPFPSSDSAPVFNVPASPASGSPPSPQSAAFGQVYKNVTGQYVAFVNNRFSLQSNVGLRLYTQYTDNTDTAAMLPIAPAIVQFSLGTNTLVSSGPVFAASAYYPFPLGDRAKSDTIVIYLFGDAVMGFGHGSTLQAPLLQQAMDGSTPITTANATPSVLQQLSIVAPNSRRDTYRIGISINMLDVWRKLTTPSAPAKNP
jgi:hypothetical protein